MESETFYEYFMVRSKKTTVLRTVSIQSIVTILLMAVFILQTNYTSRRAKPTEFKCVV